jgi:hypothetical protein
MTSQDQKKTRRRRETRPKKKSCRYIAIGVSRFPWFSAALEGEKSPASGTRSLHSPSRIAGKKIAKAMQKQLDPSGLATGHKCELNIVSS